MRAETIAKILANLRPDRGNRFASRTVKTKAAGAFKQWKLTVEAMAYEACTYQSEMSRERFFELSTCQMED